MVVGRIQYNAYSRGYPTRDRSTRHHNIEHKEKQKLPKESGHVSLRLKRFISACGKITNRSRFSDGPLPLANTPPHLRSPETYHCSPRVER